MTAALQTQAKAPTPMSSPVHSSLLVSDNKLNWEDGLQEFVALQRKPLAVQPPLVQAKLKIGSPDDEYEREADEVAEQVMSMPQPRMQRACPTCREALQTAPLANQITSVVQRQAVPEDEEEEKIQAKPLVDGILPLVQMDSEIKDDDGQMQESVYEEQPNSVQEDDKGTVHKKGAVEMASYAGFGLEERILSMKSEARPLPRSDQSLHEKRFGTNFNHVRIHTGSKANEIAEAIDAKALTIGDVIAFGAGQYKPSSLEGNILLSHELVHVLQNKLNNNDNNTVHLWSINHHQLITEAVAKGFFRNKYFVSSLVETSGLNDSMGTKIATGIPYLLGKRKGEGPDHGEDGDYKKPIDEAEKENLDRQNKYLMEALEYYKFYQKGIRITERGLRREPDPKLEDQVFNLLGMACHVAQDRGAHWEGAIGMGHDDKTMGKHGEKTDDKKYNPKGWDNAFKYTTELLRKWKNLTSKK